MEQDVENEYRNVCSTCLSSDRDLFCLSNIPQAFQTFKLLMYDFAGDRLGDLPDISHLICWECVAIMKRINKFKWQVHNAQEHIQVLALSQTQETIDHTYMTQSLSSLVVESKSDYDKIFFDYTTLPECQFIITDPMDVKNEQFGSLKDSIGLDVDEHILEVPDINTSDTQVFSHVVLDTGALVSMPEAMTHVKREVMPTLTIAPITTSNIEAGTVIMSTPKDDVEPKPGYITEYMTQEQMLASREEAKKKVQYVSSVYKCELCAIGFYTQQQVEDHFENAHRPKPGLVACKVCYVYIEASTMTAHVDQHYVRYTCKMCAHAEYSQRLMQIHTDTHLNKPTPPAVIKIEGTESKKRKKKKGAVSKAEPIKPGDLRKLLSKTTIEGYKCLECDMFFKNSRARKNHVARYHREGLQCDHCKKRFVNRTTLATHLRLHEGPLPREDCPICHKQVRCIQLKYHILRHESRSRYTCADCNKVFAHLATYRAHLKYSRAHATDHVLKFPCPMCNKGYPTKEAMQDHFNYQHLGKTSHKCPICSKPIASRANVEKHISRVHGEKKPKPRNHQCQTCGKSFTDKKALTQHEVIHSGARPLSCDICHQTFKQKASLYTHKKRVHKVYPVKKQVHYMDELPT